MALGHILESLANTLLLSLQLKGPGVGEVSYMRECAWLQVPPQRGPLTRRENAILYAYLKQA